MNQAILAAGFAGLGVFIIVGIFSTLVHRLRHGQGHRYLWGVAIIAILMAAYEYLNYLGR